MNRVVRSQPRTDGQSEYADQQVPGPQHIAELSLLASLSTLSLQQEASLSQGNVKNISQKLILTLFLLLSSSDRFISCSKISNI